MNECGHIPEWSGQRVERTNARGRHRYCVPFKAWMVEQALKPGMSMAGLAMRNQVNANQLRRWVMLDRLRAGTAPPSTTPQQQLLPVSVIAEPGRTATVARAAAPNTAIEIELCGAIVRVREGAHAQTLRTVLDALREPPR